MVRRISVAEYERLRNLLELMRILNRGVDVVYDRMSAIVARREQDVDWLCECCFNDPDMTVDDLLAKLNLAREASPQQPPSEI